MLVAAVFPEVLVIITGVASVPGLLVAVSGEVAVLVPIKLFHIHSVLSLSPFLSQSPARLLRISFFCCCSGTMLALSLSLSHSYVVSVFPELVLQYVGHHRPSYDYY